MLPILLLSFALAAADATPSDCALLPVERNGKTGYVDATGRLAIPATFDGGGFFSEGLAPASVGETMGFIDCSGAWVMTPRFAWAQECREGWCRAAERSDDFALYDRGGARFPMHGIGSPYVPSEGMVVAIGSQRRYGFIDMKSGRTVGPRFASAGSSFSEGVLDACESERHCGFVDRTGRWVIAPVYWHVAEFHDGLAQVMPTKDDVLYVDHAGKRAFATRLEDGWDFGDGIAPASADGKRWGVIDRSGAFVVAPQFDFIGNHRDGRMLFMRGERWGVIDYAGHIVLDAMFENAELLPGGIADVGFGNERGYYDRDGRAIEGIRSLDAFRDIKRIALVAQAGHAACGAFRFDVRADGTASITSTCTAPAHREAVSSPDPLVEPGRFDAPGAGEVFAVLAKFAADNDLAHYDDHRTSGGMDIEYDAIEIETATGTRSLSVAHGIAPALKMMDWSLRQAVRDLKWTRAASSP